MHFRISYLDGRPTELVEGDTLGREGSSCLVIRQTVLVIGRPREVVVRRLLAAEVDVAEVAVGRVGLEPTTEGL